MKKLLALYEYAEQMDIDVDWFLLTRASSLSVELPGGKYAIALDPSKLQSINDERVHLAHELGHCITGSFYNRYTPLDVRQKHENHADKWAIKKLIDLDEFAVALKEGNDTLALADRFGVTETLIKKAVCWYTNGNLAFENYGM